MRTGPNGCCKTPNATAWSSTPCVAGYRWRVSSPWRVDSARIMGAMPPLVNGIEVAALRETAARVEAAPKEATSRSTVMWHGGLKSAAQSRDKPAVEIDEPGALGGQNSAATPVEMLLAALGSCVISMVAARAADK